MADGRCISRWQGVALAKWVVTMTPIRTVAAGPWPLGINNTAPEGALPRNEAGRPLALREADNIDLSKEGRVRRRDGYSAVYQAQLAHSLWSDAALDVALFVDQGRLHVLHSDESVNDLGIVVGHFPLSYALLDNRIYLSNRTTCGLVNVPDWTWHAWGAPATPAIGPYTVVDGFALPKGLYQLALTVTDSLGRESGAAQAAQCYVSGDQGIHLLHLPPISEGTLNIYVSDANDQVPRLATRLLPGQRTYLITDVANGPALTTALLDQLPPGQLTCIAHGRQWVADGRILRFSPPLRYGMTDLAHNLIAFDAPIDLLQAVGSGSENAGLFIAAGQRTYWLAGADPAQFRLVDVQRHSAVPGTVTQIPGHSVGFDDDQLYTAWLSRSGRFVVGLPGGQIQPLNSPDAVIDQGGRGASLFTEHGGLQQLITTLKGRSKHGLGITDRAVAHVIYDARTP